MRYLKLVQSRRPIIRNTLAQALLTAVALASAQAALAQQSDAAQQAPEQAPTTLDQVKVTGIRSSIQSSIDSKREQTVVADVLSAEDIGDLPALSIGEAIETITGAATHRERAARRRSPSVAWGRSWARPPSTGARPATAVAIAR